MHDQGTVIQQYPAAMAVPVEAIRDYIIAGQVFLDTISNRTVVNFGLSSAYYYVIHEVDAVPKVHYKWVVALLVVNRCQCDFYYIDYFQFRRYLW